MREHRQQTSAACGVQYCHLDSSVMGMRVARIFPERLGHAELERITARNAFLKTGLVYWVTSHFPLSDHAPFGRSHTGYICATNIQYTLQLPSLPLKICDLIFETHAYRSDKSSPQLDNLARECNHYSHLKNDPRVRPAIGDTIYSIWMHNSAAGREADKIFVAGRHGSINGVVTCSLRGSRAHISLIAVDRKIRRKGVGSVLIDSVMCHAIEQGCSSIEVVTQADNFPARALYEKYGFKAGVPYHQYHLWLK